MSGYGGCVMEDGMSATHNCIADSKAQRIHMQLVLIVRVCVAMIHQLHVQKHYQVP